MDDAIAAARTRADRRLETRLQLEQKQPYYAGLQVALVFDPATITNSLADVAITQRGARQIPDGKFGNACRFENNAFMRLAGVAVETNGTWCFWLRPTVTQPGEVRILDANAYGFRIRGGRLAAFFNDGNSRTLQSDFRPEPGRWAHVAMTWDSRWLTLYVNGVLQARQNCSGPPRWPKRTVTVGARWNGNSHFLQGDLDEICFYDRTLTADDIQGLAENGLVHEDRQAEDEASGGH